MCHVSLSNHSGSVYMLDLFKNQDTGLWENKKPEEEWNVKKTDAKLEWEERKDENQYLDILSAKTLIHITDVELYIRRDLYNGYLICREWCHQVWQ